MARTNLRGILNVTDAIEVDGVPIGGASGIVAPTASVRGGVLQQPAFGNIGGAPSQKNFNDLLQALRDAGVIAAA